MIHEEVHRLEAHQDDKLFIVCLIFRLLIPKQILACLSCSLFVCLSTFIFHVYLCVYHMNQGQRPACTSLSFHHVGFSGVSHSGHLAWW